MVTVQVGPCFRCGKTTEVELTQEEFKAVAENELKIQDALPDRDPVFRELVRNGTHDACWQEIFGDDE